MQNIINAQTKEGLAVQVQKARSESKANKGILIDDGYTVFHESPSRKQNTAEGTLKNYERIFKLFLSWLKPNYPGITKVDVIDKKVAREYAQYLWGAYKTYKGQRMSENTYNCHIGALQTIFDIIAENKNVWKSIERKEENKKKHLRYNELEDEITGFHCFRHTFISECVKNSMDIVWLSTITGDSIKTLQKYYIHLKDEVIKKEAEKLPSF